MRMNNLKTINKLLKEIINFLEKNQTVEARDVIRNFNSMEQIDLNKEKIKEQKEFRRLARKFWALQGNLRQDAQTKELGLYIENILSSMRALQKDSENQL